MAVHIRLARHGSKKSPFYRIVVSDQRNSRDGRFIEHIGTFDPRVAEGQLRLDKERYGYWASKGALPSATVSRLIKTLAGEAS